MMTLSKNDCKIFYCDTDSILFTCSKNSSPSLPLPIGPAVGDFKYEVPEMSQILSFDAFGRKNFKMQVKHPNETETETITKICGMTIAPQFVKENLQKRDKENFVEVPQLRNRFSKAHGFHKPTISKFTLRKERNCERIIKYDTVNLETAAWGSH